MAAAARWYQDELASPGGVDARAYLERRGLSATAIATFALGYAPDSRTRLKAALNSYGVPALVEAGLLIQPEDNGREPYDRRSEEHTSELQSLMRISYAVFGLKKKNN